MEDTELRKKQRAISPYPDEPKNENSLGANLSFAKWLRTTQSGHCRLCVDGRMIFAVVTWIHTHLYQKTKTYGAQMK